MQEFVAAQDRQREAAQSLVLPEQLGRHGLGRWPKAEEEADAVFDGLRAERLGGDDLAVGQAEVEVGLAARVGGREAHEGLDQDDLRIPRDGLVV